MSANQEAWSWVVVVMTFIALLLNTSMSFIAGVMHVAITNTYQDDVIVTSWLGSLYSCMFALSGPVASVIITRWDCRTCVTVSGVLSLVGFAASSAVQDMRWLFLTYAMLAGLGQGLCYTGCLVALGYYFKERTSLATGVGIAGCGTGNMILPPLAEVLVETYGLNGAFRILGGLAFQACVCGCLLRPSKIEHAQYLERKRQMRTSSNIGERAKVSLMSFLSMVDASFVCFLLSSFLFTIGCSTLKLYLPEYIMLQGASYKHASLLVSLIGVGSLMSRVCLGIASVEQKIGPFILFAGCTVMTSVLVYFIKALTSTPVLQIVFAVLYGVYNGGNWTLFNPMTYSIVGIDRLASGVGTSMFLCGIGYLIGGPLSAKIYEASGDYDKAFIFSATSFLVSSVLALVATACKPHSKETEQDVIDVLDIPERDTLVT